MFKQPRFRIGSGYVTKNKKHKWRVWDNEKPGFHNGTEVRGKNNLPLLFDTPEAAQKRADKLNELFPSSR